MAAPYSNPFTRAQILDKIDNIIGSTLATTWSDAKKEDIVDTALAEISEAVPYVMVDIYQLETRRGRATSTSADNLVDATNTQFASTDVGKVIYNVTDRTWAQIQSFSSTSQVGLTADIMTSGEQYEVYNKNCVNHSQINISDSGDFLKVLGVVYPVEPDGMFYGAKDNRKGFELLEQNKILQLDLGWYDNTKDTNAYKDVHVYLARQHHLEYNTDLAGAATADGAAGATSLAVDGLTASGTYYKNSLFYFTTIDAIAMNSRLVYRLTADVTLSSGAGTLNFFPALECGVSNNDTIQFISSTLTADLESILIRLVAGQILEGEGIDQVNKFSRGGTSVARDFITIGGNMIRDARARLKALIDVDQRANMVYSR